jgi:hypothetical protein
MDIEANKIGGDFIAPDTSFPAKKFILAARAMMYAGDDGKEGEAIDQAIEGSPSLVDGSIPIIAMVIENVEAKLGELSPEDLKAVAVHLAGTIVEIARERGDPEAQIEDGKKALMQITQGVLDVLTNEGGTEQPMDSMNSMQPSGDLPPLLSQEQMQ